MRSDTLDRLYETWSSPVFGDSFRSDTANPEYAIQQLDQIARHMASELTSSIILATPVRQQASVNAMVTQEILPKTIGFCPALTIGEIDDIPRLADFSASVGLMYWADQTMDRGNPAMLQAVEQLSQADAASARSPREVQRIAAALRLIGSKVTAFARTEDVPVVLDCFYGQVLANEARMRHLSDNYLGAANRQHFLAGHAHEIADTITINAGFPSVSSSLYAIYRQHRALPPLTEVHGDPVMKNVIQACNATVRLWDELGDWQMDRGDDPRTGIFTINPLNEYHPEIVAKLCSLANIGDEKQISSLQESFASFHDSKAARSRHTQRITSILRTHARQFIQELPLDIWENFGQYLTLCKRVLEIGYINRIGDIALMAND